MMLKTTTLSCLVARRLFLLATLCASLAVLGCDSDEEPGGGDTGDTSDADLVEPCPASGAKLQAAPVLLTVGPTSTGTTDTLTINLNNDSDVPLCFPASDVVVAAPEVEGLSFGPIMAGGAEVTRLEPDQQGTIQLSYAPTERATGEALLTVSSDNGGSAELTFEYTAIRGDVVDEPLGTVVINASFGYLYDPMQFGAAAYRDSNPQGLMLTPAANGSLDSVLIPAVDSMDTVAYALHVHDDGGGSGDFVEIHQRSYVGAAFDTELVGPQLSVIFPSDMIAAQAYTLDPLAPTAEGNALVIVTDPAQSCLAAVGVGELTVTSAENTTELEGGTLALRSGAINLYHPAFVPDGDASDTIEGLGYTLCTP